MKRRKKPALRFKGFVNDWEQRKLGNECFEIVAGGDVDKTKLLQDGKYPVIANALTDEGIIGYYANEYRIKAPAVTVTGRGDVGHARARKINFTPVVRLLSVISKHDVDFLAEAIDQNDIVLESTGVPQLTVPALANYLLCFPPTVKEEKRIGQYFSQLNHLITLHQRKLKKLQNLKKAMLEKMFPKNGAKIPEIRFKGFTDDWEQRKFKNEVKISNEMVDPKTGLFDELIHIGPGDIEPYTGQLVSEIKTVKESDLISGKFHFYKGNIIYSKIRPELSKCVIAPEDGLASADTYVLHGNENICQEFLYCMLQTRSFYSYSTSVSMRTGMPKINREELGSYDFYVPSIKEQRTIGDFLIGLGKRITLHQRKLEKLQNLKKAMLEKMFI